MKNEFEKLDLFMKRNVASMTKEIPSRKKWDLKNPGRIQYVFALGLSAIICWGVIDYQTQKTENVMVLSEVLEWDVTYDENMEEVDAIAMLEI